MNGNNNSVHVRQTTENHHNQMVAHVSPGVSRARGGVITWRGMVLEREVRELGVPLSHDEAAREVIAAELVACTLGQRHRWELRTDTAGKVLALRKQLAC